MGGKVLSWIISLSANPVDVCCHRLKAIYFFILKQNDSTRAELRTTQCSISRLDNADFCELKNLICALWTLV